MLEKIITYLNLKLELTGYFEKIYCLAELKESSDGDKRPVIYEQKGGAIDINNLSKYYGLSYWRKNSDVTIGFDSNDFHPANGNTLIINFPLRLVIAVKKSQLARDDNYSEDRLAQTLIKQLSENTSDLRKLINAKGARVSISSYSTDNNSILSQEYSGLNQFDIDYSIAYISFSVNVEVRATKDCIQSECDSLDSDILHAFDFCEDKTYNRLSNEQILCLSERLSEPATANITVNGSAFTSEEIAAGASETIDVPVINSESTPLGSISGGNVVISDITFTDSDGTQTQEPAGVNLECTQISSATCAQLNINLTQLQRDVINRRMPLKTGQTISYATGDDGDLEKGFGSNFLTLPCNNSFGNTNRFTNSVGGSATDGSDGSIANYTIDHATGLGWKISTNTASAWSTAINNANSSTFGGYSGYRLPNVRELLDIMSFSSAFPLNYSPFLINIDYPTGLWTGNTSPYSSSVAFVIYPRFSAASVIININIRSKVDNMLYLICRNHF